MERKEMILLTVVLLLVVTAVIQTVQLVKLGDSPVTMQSTSSSMPVQSGSSGSGSSPTSLDDLPSMVGGC